MSVVDVSLPAPRELRNSGIRTEGAPMTRFVRTLLALLLLSVAAYLAIPAAFPAVDDWQPIDPADLALKDNPKAPGADAMILYRNSMIDARESSDLEYLRIKIFTQAGAKWADVEIPFIKGFDDIKDIRARTIRPDGTIVNFDAKPFEKTVVKVSGLKYLAKTFTLPDVQPGCLIEYQYKDQYDARLYFNNKWTVQGELFTRLARFAIKPGQVGAQLYYRSFHLPSNIVPQLQSNGWYALEVRDLPGIEEEAYMPPEKSIQARIEFYYRSPSDPQKETADQFWKRIGKSWNESVDHYVDKKSVLAADVSHTISPDDPPETKLRKIYARVQQIRNLTMEDSKTEKEEKTEKLKLNVSVEDVLKHGYGGSRQINYTFIGLLRAAGFDADAIFIAPRNGDSFRPEIADTDQLDTDLVWTHAGTKDYFLDPGARFYAFGSLPWYESSTKGIRVSKEGAMLVQTPDLPSLDSTIVRHVDVAMDDEGSVSGKLLVDFTGLEGAARRHDDRDEDEAGRKKSLQDEIKGWLPGESTFEVTTIANWDNIDEPLHVEGTVKVPGVGTSAGRRMLVPAELFQASQAKAFQSQKRVNPIYFSHAFEELDDLKLSLPSGFKPESVPPAAAVKPGPVSYEIAVDSKGDQVEVKRHLVINAIAFPATSYPAFRTFFNSVKTDDDAQIVLQSAQSAKNN
jgi:hypothetical protein